MDKQVAIDLIAVLSRSSDKALIHKVLLKVRSDLVGRNSSGIELFYRLNGIPPLVRLISKPYEKILDVALSILANCCVNKMCCKQAIDQGVVPPLLSILKSIPSTSVQCRACRLLGNLARVSNEKICGLAKGIGVAIAAVLEDSKDVNTLNMAIRAARLLWNEMPFYDEFIRHGGVKKILNILLRYTKVEVKVDENGVPLTEAFEDHMDIHVRNIQFMESINSKVFDREILKKEHRADGEMFDYTPTEENRDLNELLSEILRSLQTLTNRLSYRVVCDMLSVEFGCHCIVYFARLDSPFREQSLKILSNLSRSGNSTEHLSKADAVNAACKLITNKDLVPTLTEVEERHCISIICLLAGDACNRAKIRISGAFTRIMDIAKHTKCDAVLTTILIGLQNFRYDNNSIDQMIRVGLVSVLVERLGISTRDLSETHVKRVMKRPYSGGNASGGDASSSGSDELGMNREDVAMDVGVESAKRKMLETPMRDMSPMSCYSYPNSPCSSKSVSPKAMSPGAPEFYEDGDVASEYSPVCSDIEDDTLASNGDAPSTSSNAGNRPAGPLSQSSEIMRLLDECSRVESVIDDAQVSDEEEMNIDVEEPPAPPVDETEQQKTVQLIIDTLCNVSLRIKHASDLCTAPILNTLVRACRVAYRRRETETRWDAQGAPLVLSHIVEETINFLPIIKQDIIFKIYDMTQIQEDHNDCVQCHDLKLVGEGLLSQLRAVGETGYGRGEMAHLLLKGDKKMNKQIAIVTTYIIGKPKFLHTLLVEYGGLYTVMECILSNNDEMNADAATGLTALSRQLHITVPEYDEKRIDCRGGGFSATERYTTEEDEQQDRVIQFIAGEEASSSSSHNETVAFNRETLIGYSEVFASMLNNDFRESKDKQIRLKKQTHLGIRFFLDSVNQVTSSKCIRRPSGRHIGPVLETYDMAQIYMLPDLEKDVYNLIVSLLAPETALAVFEFAMSHHKPELSEIAINYYLSCSVAGSRKVAMCRAADDCEFSKEWNQMMLDAVVYTCQNLIQ